jgi:C-methyltransferase C-terminal domain/Putative zinc binding domain/Methyltransferase domain
MVPVTDLRPGRLASCQICGSAGLQRVIDMGYSAPCDSLLKKDQLHAAETSYPLNLLRCRDCGLVQIDYVVDPRELFYPDYPYRSGITETLRRNLHAMAAHVGGRIGLRAGSLVVDIGSNDGSILEGFKALGMRVTGVEPTKIARIAEAAGIPTINAFFDRAIAARIVREQSRASLVTAANVFAHVNQLGTLLHGIGDLLEEGGYFVSESHYMLSILDTLQYDSIYHEHLRYYLLRPLERLFGAHGFTLVDAERIPNYGGSIRAYARKGTGHAPAARLRELAAEEQRAAAYDDATYERFAERIRRSRRELRSLMVRLHDEGKRVVGVGCPGRCVTLLAYCGITPDLMPYIAEQATSLKLGLYTPSTHIPVVDEAVMLEEQPDYALLLSWHYAQPIMRALRAKGLRSKIIVPLPELQILE